MGNLLTKLSEKLAWWREQGLMVVGLILGGIWCLWKSNFMPVVIVSTSRYCIHQKLNPNSPDYWFFSVIYASPNVSNRKEVWQEIRDFNSTYLGCNTLVFVKCFL